MDNMPDWIEEVKSEFEALVVQGRLPKACVAHPVITGITAFPKHPGSCLTTLSFDRWYQFSRTYTGDKDVMFRVYYSHEFPQSEVDVLNRGFEKLRDVLWTQRFADAVRQIRNFTYPLSLDKPIVEEYEPWPAEYSEDLKLYLTFAGRFINFRRDARRYEELPWKPRFQRVFVERFSENSDTWGQGGIWTFASREVCNIAFNEYIINNVSTDRERWAGVIMHELMHNFGWEHDANPNQRDEYIYQVQEVVRNL